MAPFHREAALKAAEKARRLGRIDVAVAEHLRIVEAQPRDWNSANTLGRLDPDHRERGEAAHAIEWFERAAETPTTADAGRALLYDLGETLEGTGEHSRALAVFVELSAESGGFRDVTDRIERLSTIQAKG